jgi:hypothetical protein
VLEGSVEVPASQAQATYVLEHWIVGASENPSVKRSQSVDQSSSAFVRLNTRICSATNNIKKLVRMPNPDASAKKIRREPQPTDCLRGTIARHKSTSINVLGLATNGSPRLVSHSALKPLGAV